MLRQSNDGQKLRKKREAMGMEVIELAFRAGVSPRTIERIERGEVEQPRKATLRVLESALGNGDAA